MRAASPECFRNLRGALGGAALPPAPIRRRGGCPGRPSVAAAAGCYCWPRPCLLPPGWFWCLWGAGEGAPLPPARIRRRGACPGRPAAAAAAGYCCRKLPCLFPPSAVGSYGVLGGAQRCRPARSVGGGAAGVAQRRLLLPAAAAGNLSACFPHLLLVLVGSWAGRTAGAHLAKFAGVLRGPPSGGRLLLAEPRLLLSWCCSLLPHSAVHASGVLGGAQRCRPPRSVSGGAAPAARRVLLLPAYSVGRCLSSFRGPAGCFPPLPFVPVGCWGGPRRCRPPRSVGGAAARAARQRQLLPAAVAGRSPACFPPSGSGAWVVLGGAHRRRPACYVGGGAARTTRRRLLLPADAALRSAACFPPLLLVPVGCWAGRRAADRPDQFAGGQPGPSGGGCSCRLRVPVAAPSLFRVILVFLHSIILGASMFSRLAFAQQASLA